MTDLEHIDERISVLKRKIRRYTQELNSEKVNRRLTLVKHQGPRIIGADELMSSYRFLDEALEIPHLGVTLYPLYVEMECTYPKWAQKVDALQLLPFKQSAKEMEILVEAISNCLNISIDEAQAYISKHKLRVPRVLVGTYETKNLDIDFSIGEPLENDYHQTDQSDDYSFGLDDDQIMKNRVTVRMLLVVPNHLR